MTRFAADSTYRANIPQQVADTFVKYYITVTDSAANLVTYGSSAVDGTQRDTLRGFFFYNVLNRALTINDVQRTPFTNGRTPYLGALLTLRGIITADTASMMPPPVRFRGSSAWYMQSGNTPWSGIWVYNDTLSAGLLGLQVGDSVAITGSIQENSEVTTLRPVSTIAPVVYSHNNPTPAPVVLPTSTFGPGVANGMISAEQYESMLVQFNNVVMPDSEPTFQDIYEYAVDNSSSPVLVRRDGTNHFTTTVNDSVGKVLIRRNDRISYLRGIVFYAGGGGGFRYKFVPRTNADFGTITSVEIERQPTIATSFALAQNYPNPFNPSTSIHYTLPKNEYVSVRVFNILGQEVETLVNQQQAPGEYTVRFDASRLTSGVYFYQLRAGTFSDVRKMMLVK
jgi:predicted extracellular nuclease